MGLPPLLAGALQLMVSLWGVTPFGVGETTTEGAPGKKGGNGDGDGGGRARAKGVCRPQGKVVANSQGDANNGIAGACRQVCRDRAVGKNVGVYASVIIVAAAGRGRPAEGNLRGGKTPSGVGSAAKVVAAKGVVELARAVRVTKGPSPTAFIGRHSKDEVIVQIKYAIVGIDVGVCLVRRRKFLGWQSCRSDI